MITAKIFKVKETIEHGGKKFYRVLGYNNKFDYFFNNYSFAGAKENETFIKALKQIDTLIDCSVVSDKTIHVVFPKKENYGKQKETSKVGIDR